MLVMCFNIFRKDILAGGQFDHIFLTTDDVEMTLFVKAAQIAGAEESLAGEGLSVSFRILVVARHHYRPPDYYFTNAFSVRFVDPDFDAVQRRAHRSNPVIL